MFCFVLFQTLIAVESVRIVRPFLFFISLFLSTSLDSTWKKTKKWEHRLLLFAFWFRKPLLALETICNFEDFG